MTEAASMDPITTFAGRKNGLVRTLINRQPVLSGYGFLALAGFVVTLALQWIDPRQLDGVDVWVKPAKFFVSVGVYSLTLAWFFGYVRESRRTRAPMQFIVWGTVLLTGFEMVWITWQAAHGVPSHFNSTTPIAIVMYALMGIAIVTAIAALPVLAWEIARRPVGGVRPDYIAAVVLGLVLTFLLGGGLGGYMGAQHGHSVGLDGGHLALFGWNRQGGDLRVAHFFGMHIMQALPLLMAMAAPLPKPVRWAVLAAGVSASIGVTLFTFVQAINGQPFLSGL